MQDQKTKDRELAEAVTCRTVCKGQCYSGTNQ